MTSSAKGTSYWVVQIIVSAVAAIALPATGVLLFTLSPEEPARGFILILIGTAFFALLIERVYSYSRMSVTQRAIYAWAITQRGVEVPLTKPTRFGPDLITLSVAARASNGKLSAAELSRLQALDPGNPYPGVWPSAPPTSPHAAGE